MATDIRGDGIGVIVGRGEGGLAREGRRDVPV